MPIMKTRSGRPTARKIAFVLIKEGSKNIVHLINPDGSGSEAITPQTQSAIHPAFTPDGKAILYCTNDDLRPPEKNNSEIYAIDLATKAVRTHHRGRRQYLSGDVAGRP